MISCTELDDGIIPLGLLLPADGLVSLLNFADQFSNLLLVFIDVVITFELSVNSEHPGQSPAGLGEIQHLALNVAEWNAFALRLVDNARNQAFFRFAHGLEARSLCAGSHYRSPLRSFS